MENEMIVVDADFYANEIVKVTELMEKETDPKKIEAYGKLLENLGKLYQQAIQADTDVALAIESNELKGRELDIQEKKVKSDDKRNWLGLAGGVLTFIGGCLVPVLNTSGALEYLKAYKTYEGEGMIINTQRSMIPNLFTRNK